MLNRPSKQSGWCISSFLRKLHASPSVHVLKQKKLPVNAVINRYPVSNSQKQDGKESLSTKNDETRAARHVKRNELGVQLLSRKLHRQVFQNVSFPQPSAATINIAREHLQMHDLDPAQGSVLPDIGFTLPPLQGRDLDEHFFRVGKQAAEPWLSLANDLANGQIPPKPDCFHIQSGWTKYHYHPDGSSYSVHVDFPEHEGMPEEMLVFDVETMPEHHPYAVMACAMSTNGWYTWLSPWLLGESDDPRHLIRLGDPRDARIVVGHNVSYDRARIFEEYSLEPTQSRFLDTMALHVAVKGISSHQRPAWMKYQKSKEREHELQEEAVEAVVELVRATEEKEIEETDVTKRDELRRLKQDMMESLPTLQADEMDTAEAELSSKRWEDLTCANSLADVAKLHCGIEIDKAPRNDFMTCSREEILDNIHDYLTYCSNDVSATHAVFSKALPEFLRACPSPVSFAGILTMGSSFLTVNESWTEYLHAAESKYKELEDKVKKRLHDLAEKAKEMMISGSWKDDVWLSQLDWTPKVVRKSRGISPEAVTSPIPAKAEKPSPPFWYNELLTKGPSCSRVMNRTLPLLLQLSFENHPLQYSVENGWHYSVEGKVRTLPSAGGKKVISVLGVSHGSLLLRKGQMSAADFKLALDICNGVADIDERILQLAERLSQTSSSTIDSDPWLRQLDWKSTKSRLPVAERSEKIQKKPPAVMWPKWYWELAKPKKDKSPGTVDITVRSRIAPALLRLSWLNWPLFHSREHGWIFRVPTTASFETRQSPLLFFDAADEALQQSALRGGFDFYKLPHKDGEKANVGSPLGKTFIKYAQDGTLTSPGGEAKDALDMNAQCSYWISARDRILNQMVVWQNQHHDMSFGSTQENGTQWGIIIPQVITMGTVTRRAIEKTWLTASNAKKNRVGSELKAMVRAPPGYAIVGADVDSEELWISSCMGDAQFGLHGSTAIGWMTLEGTKAAGTDLHSKTASILGISRDQAKVFNYSRIYGAGMRHAILLLLQSNAGMLPDKAQQLAQNLYASTKGKNTHRNNLFGRKFWFGGTESFLFNKLEEIALSDKPQTPALGCGVTYALSKEYLPEQYGADYMPSRVNWVVQSSGVDYLHLLIVSMQHMIEKYDINARYLISVHDELRYLVKEEDKYRAALALQIANIWTRSLFAFRLGMDDLPQGVAFFSAVDVDHVLRKEVDMPCVTPSQPIPIPAGESLDITKILEKTNNGSLWKDQRPMTVDVTDWPEKLEGYQRPNCMQHRAESTAFLKAQATSELAEIKHLAEMLTDNSNRDETGKRSPKRQQKRASVGDGNGFDWSVAVEEAFQTSAQAQL